MMTIRPSYLAVLAILLAGSALLFFTRQSNNVSDTTQMPDTKPVVSSGNTGFPPAIAEASVAESENQKKPQAPLPGIRQQLDWNKYPGTLDSQIHRALDNHDGEMAMNAAEKLWKCPAIARQLNSSDFPQPPSLQDPAVQAMRLKHIQEDQRQNADCQTVAGDREQLRARLLDVALEKKVVGAAVESFNLGVRRPDVLQGAVRDAQTGDVFSLAMVASCKTTDFEISADTQRAIRYALVVASNDPEVGKLLGRTLRTAELSAMQTGGETSPKFDTSNLSDNVRNEGKAIAERIVSRVKSGG